VLGKEREKNNNPRPAGEGAGGGGKKKRRLKGKGGGRKRAYLDLFTYREEGKGKKKEGQRREGGVGSLISSFFCLVKRGKRGVRGEKKEEVIFPPLLTGGRKRELTNRMRRKNLRRGYIWSISPLSFRRDGEGELEEKEEYPIQLNLLKIKNKGGE